MDDGMVKVVLAASQDLPDLDGPRMQLVKISSRGLRGNDFKSFIKRAGWRLADTVRTIELATGEQMVHNTAMGATEFYGANRNGDGFKEATCREYHPTFVKFARWYRNHQNKDPRKSYGVIKHSDFNEDMKRIELLIALNGTKEAAEHNGGLVADRELERLHRGEDISTSMACKVAHDVCAACGNKARNRSEYCLGEDEGGFCKRGGVKNRMGFVHEDGFMNHVDNPRPAFFDMSGVLRGADRTSSTNGIVKSASGLILGGAGIAEFLEVTAPDYLVDNPWPTRIEKLASTLARMEAEFDSGRSYASDVVLSPEFHSELPKSPSDSIHNSLAALAMQKIALPVGPWLKLVHGPSEWASPEMISSGLPGIYGRMLADGTIKEASAVLPSLDKCVSLPVSMWAAAMMEDYSLTAEHTQLREKRAALYGITRPEIRKPALIKTAGAAENLARAYALYKLAFLNSWMDRDSNFEQTCRMAVRQNYV